MKKYLHRLIPSTLILMFSNMSIAFEEPVIASYALQPIERFNQNLADAQLQQLSWSFHPQNISAEYTGHEFVLLKVKQTNEKIITYNVHQDKDQNQTLLLILTLNQNGQYWRLEEAQLSWQCQNRDDRHFNTKPCSLSPTVNNWW